MHISGRRILVTGSSRGIGRALAERFAAEGARVALVARSEGPLQELAARLGGRAYPADLNDPVAVEGLIKRIEADGGGIDILVNNAGISNVDYVLNHTAEDIEAIFRTNVLTPMHLCRQVIPSMIERGRGHIVNMSSLAAVLTPPGLVHYGASKAALSHYTAGLRQDLRGLPITLTLVQIGSVPTELDDMSRRYPPLREMIRRTERTPVISETSRACHTPTPRAANATYSRPVNTGAMYIGFHASSVHAPKSALLRALCTHAPSSCQTIPTVDCHGGSAVGKISRSVNARTATSRMPIAN